MCGIVGMAGPVATVKHEKMLKQMLIMDVLRGEDSTGVVTQDIKGKTKVAKAALLPPDLFQMKQFKKSMQGTLCAMIGHNRLATVGDVDYHSAHPFEHEHIIGVHNGTLQGWRSDLDDDAQFEVDSDCLIYNLAKNDPKDVFESIRGAWACVWINRRDNTINMTRNDKRTLFLSHSHAGDDLFFSSEEWMMQVASSRNDIKLRETYPLRENVIYSWDLPTKGGFGLKKPRAQGITPLPPVQTYQSGARWNDRNTSRSGNNFAGANSGQGNNNQAQQPVNHKGEVIALTAPKEKICQDHNKEFMSFQKKAVNFYAMEFVVFSSMATKEKRSGYLHGVMSDDPWHDIKVYCDEADAEVLLDHDGELRGEVTGYSASWVSQQGKLMTGNLSVSYSSIDCIPDMGNKLDGVVVEPQQVTGPFGQSIDKKEFEALAKDGCGVCSCNVQYGDDCEWFNNAPICQECSEDTLPNLLSGEA